MFAIALSLGRLRRLSERRRSKYGNRPAVFKPRSEAPVKK
jgi:hypothetical protein